MKKKIVANLVILLLILSLFEITLKITPAVVSGQSEAYREVWKIVNVTNPNPYSTIVDIDVNVSSRKGVYIACSTNITRYFENFTDWQGQGYTSCWDWLNGTMTLPYHWGEMDWFVSDGSLTSISYDEIQHWGDMYMDSGGGVEYVTFMGNTYMADWNLTDPDNDPDIISEVYMQGNEIRIIDDLPIPPNSIINLVFKIVITESGAYTFNLTTTLGVIISPSTWKVGGVATLLVPDEYPTIQEAINAASPGDTILVFPKTYSESLTITEANLTLRSTDGAASTIINGEGGWGLAVNIQADDVTFQGFTIKNFKATPTAYIGAVLVEGDNAKFSNNVIKDITSAEAEPAGIGIDVHAKDVQIINNTVHDVGSIGIRVRDNWVAPTGVSNNVLIENNTVHRTNNTGVLVTGYAKGVTIRNNEIYESLKPTPYNIFVHYNSSDVIIQGNNIHDTYSNIVLGGCNNITISDNTIENTEPHPTVPTVKGKNIYILNDYGAWTGDPTLLSTNISITKNNIQNGGYGIRITNTTAMADPTPMVSTTTINYNNITDNTLYGVENTIIGADVDARYNWWGNETGPHHPTLNPNGLGDNVTDNVEFEPWLIQPYPPAVQVSVIYIDPSLTEYWSPAYGSTFVIHVKANVTLLAGFQFKLSWNGTLLNLTDATYSPPWTPFVPVYENLTTNSYTLALSGQNNSIPYPFNGSTTLATLTFKTIYDPIFPENATCNLALEDVILGAPGENETITCLIHNGTYSCYATKPKVALMPQVTVAKNVPLQFDVKINVTNVVNLYAFEFNLTYNPAIIEALTVEVEPFFSGSYYVAAAGVNNEEGFVFVRVNSISPPANGSGPLARVTFKVKSTVVWPEEPLTCNLTFYDSKLLRAGNMEIKHDAVKGTYRYEPVKGDLNKDGTVGLWDLTAVALAFGTRIGEPNWISDFDLIRDGVINILDVIVVASNYGGAG